MRRHLFFTVGPTTNEEAEARLLPALRESVEPEFEVEFFDRRRWFVAGLDESTIQALADVLEIGLRDPAVPADHKMIASQMLGSFVSWLEREYQRPDEA